MLRQRTVSTVSNFALVVLAIRAGKKGVKRKHVNGWLTKLFYYVAPFALEQVKKLL